MVLIDDKRTKKLYIINESIIYRTIAEI